MQFSEPLRSGAKPTSAQQANSPGLMVPVGPMQVGPIALLVGVAGTGKSMAAGAIATSLRQPLCVLDLHQICPEHWEEVLDSLDAIRYPILLIESASVWFGRNSPLPRAKLAQWLQRRQSVAGLTLLSAQYLHTVKVQWRQQMDAVLALSLPHKPARTILWRQSFSGTTCSEKINWALLAKQFKLSGGEIQAIASNAIAIAQFENAQNITPGHIQRALRQQDKS